MIEDLGEKSPGSKKPQQQEGQRPASFRNRRTSLTLSTIFLIPFVTKLGLLMPKASRRPDGAFERGWVHLWGSLQLRQLLPRREASSESRRLSADSSFFAGSSTRSSLRTSYDLTLDNRKDLNPKNISTGSEENNPAACPPENHQSSCRSAQEQPLPPGTSRFPFKPGAARKCILLC